MARFVTICKYCGKEYLAMTYKSHHCGDPECSKAYGRDVYAKTLYDHVCVVCGNTFQNHCKEELMQTPPKCKNCVRGKGSYKFKQQVEHVTKCRQCGSILASRLVNNTRSDSEHITWTTCDDCKSKNNQKTAERMRLENPMYFGNTLTEEEYDLKQQRIAEQEKYKQEHKEEIKKENARKTSERMRRNNPMFREDVRERVSGTITRKLETGELVYPRGCNHKNWKGNNGRVRDQLRIPLHEWRKINLTRANYTCERCGKTNCELHIHHTEPFFDIVNKCAEKLNINVNEISAIKEDKSDYTDEFKLLREEVVKYHSEHDVGIVVCIDCHDEVDPQFRKPKKLKQDK